MNSYLIDAVASASQDIQNHVAVTSVCELLVSRVENKHSLDAERSARKELSAALKVTKYLAAKLVALKESNKALKDENTTIQLKAQRVRDVMANEISDVLIESGRTVYLRKQIKFLNNKLKECKKSVRELRLSDKDLRSQLKLSQSRLEVVTGSSETYKARAEAAEALVESLRMELVKATAEEAAAKTTTPPPPPPGEVEVGSILAETPASGCVSDTPGELSLTPLLESPAKEPEKPKPPTPCLLADSPEVELLHVFSFLDTIEVLSCAQVNRFVFQRVDELFGLDSQITAKHWRVPVPGTYAYWKSNSLSSGDGKAVVSITEGQAQFSSNITINESELTIEGMKKQLQHPGLTAQQRGRLEMALAAALAAEEEKAQDDDSGGVSGFFGAFTSTLSNSAHPSVLDSIDETTGVFPDEALDLFAKSLSSPEMAALQKLNNSMKELLSQKAQVDVELDDVQAKLTSTETVRDFLIAKLKSAEQALKSSLKDANKLRRQQANDAEIISFLDLSNQELEGAKNEAEFKQRGTQSALELLKEHHDQMVGKHEADFAGLQHKFDQNEASNKAAKKLLIKEVKNLRSAVDDCTTERDILKAQIRAACESLRLSGAMPMLS